MIGKVEKWKTPGGYGFIRSPELPRDAFVHYTDVVGGLKELVVGDTVEFEIGAGESGPKAINVRVVQKR